MERIRRNLLVIGLMALAIGVGCGVMVSADDTAGPTITNAAVSPSAVYPGTSVIVTADISDPSGIAGTQVAVYREEIASATLVSGFIWPGAGVTNYTFNYVINTTGFAEGTYRVDVASLDNLFTWDGAWWTKNITFAVVGTFQVGAIDIVREAELYSDGTSVSIVDALSGAGLTIVSGNWHAAAPWEVNRGSLVNGKLGAFGNIGDAVSYDINVPLGGVYLVELVVDNDVHKQNIRVDLDGSFLGEIEVNSLEPVEVGQQSGMATAVGSAGVAKLTAGTHNLKLTVALTTFDPTFSMPMAVIDYVRLTSVTDAYDLGYADGAGAHAGDYQNGYNAGYTAGEFAHAGDYDAGYGAGYTAGEFAGYTAGELAHAGDYDAGYGAGYTAGEFAHAGDYDAGYSAGYAAAELVHAGDYAAGYSAGLSAGFSNGWNALLAKLPPGIRNAIEKAVGFGREDFTGFNK